MEILFLLFYIENMYGIDDGDDDKWYVKILHKCECYVEKIWKRKNNEKIKVINVL